MNLSIESEQEADGRWLAEVPQLLGVLAYGASRDEALRLGGAYWLSLTWHGTLKYSEEAMETGNTAGRHAGTLALGGAVIIAALALVAGEGDPEAMSLGVLAAIVFVSPFAMMAPRLPHDRTYRSAMGVALAATFILFWGIGAVGFMGTDDEHPNDLLYIVVPVVGIIGAITARFRPHGMALALFATAFALMLVPVIVVIAGLNLVPISMSELISFTLIQNGPFAALYVGSALLFRKAAREPRPARAQPKG